MPAGTDASNDEINTLREIFKNFFCRRFLCISILAEFSNCCGIQEFGVKAANSVARSIAPFIPFRGGSVQAPLRML